MNELLGGRIKEFRIARGLTQKRVAELIGVSETTYSRIENGKRNISYIVLSDLACVFNIDVCDITSVLDERDYPHGKLFEMLDLFYANKHLYGKLNGC